MTDETAATETTETDRAALTVQFKAAIKALVTQPAYATEVDVVLVSLIDVTESLLRRAVRLEPAALPVVLQRLDALRSHVADAVPRVEAETPRPEPTWH